MINWLKETYPVAPLHCHSDYSIMDSVGTVEDRIKYAKKLGLKALALTDHGNINSFLEFFSLAKKYEIKPIFGIEAYLVFPGIEDKKFHITLLAKNNEGFQNLIKIANISWGDEFMNGPRINFVTLGDLYKGLIVMSGCLQSLFFYLYKNRGEKEALGVLSVFKECFKDDFYLEFIPLEIPEQREYLNFVSSFSQKAKIPVVLTEDIHYNQQKDHNLYLIIKKIKALQFKSSETFDVSSKYTTSKLYFKTVNEIKSLRQKFFPEIPQPLVEEAISRVSDVLEKISVVNFLVQYKLEIGKSNDIIRKELEEAVFRKFNSIKYQENERLERKRRIENEFEVICNKGFLPYFYIEWKIVKYASENNILLGPGRGSVSGSLVAYYLGITKVDPIRFGLLFERFLNKEAKSYPDIDIDCEEEKREKLISFINNEIGKTISVGVPNRYRVKILLRDLLRIRNLSSEEINSIFKDIPLSVCELDKLKNYSSIKKIFKRFSELESELIGIGEPIRFISQHPAGFIFLDNKNTGGIPIIKRGQVQLTGWSEDFFELINLFKFDFLSSRYLSILASIKEMVLANFRKEIEFEKIPLELPKVLSSFAKADTEGIMQFVSDGMKNLLRQFQPTSFMDLVICNSLYRPGPLSLKIDIFGLGLKDFIETSVSHVPKIKEILSETKGLLIFQEQILKILVQVFAFTWEEAEFYRKSLSKGDIENDNFKKLQEKIKMQLPKDYGDFLDSFNSFSKYSFNKAHAVAYTLIGYWLMFFKVFFPREFLIASLNHATIKEGFASINSFVRYARKKKIRVLYPDVNKSDLLFSFSSNNTISFGLSFIKVVSKKVIERTIALRPFSSVEDFLKKVKPPANSFEALIKANAFNSLAERAKLLEFYLKEKGDEVLYDLEFLGTLPEHPIEKIRDEIKGSLRISKFYDRKFTSSELISYGLVREIKNWKNYSVVKLDDSLDEYNLISFKKIPDNLVGKIVKVLVEKGNKFFNLKAIEQFENKTKLA